MEYIERKQLFLLLQKCRESDSYIEKLVQAWNTDQLIAVISSCQSAVITVGNQLESFLSSDARTIHVLEQYCENLFCLSQETDPSRCQALCKQNQMLLKKALKLCQQELHLDQKILLFEVDLQQFNNDEDILEKKIEYILQILGDTPNTIGYWYVDLTKFLRDKLVRPEYLEHCQRLFSLWQDHPNCYLDMSRNAQNALELCDAFYGTEGDMCDLFARSHKPCMIMDVNLLSEADIGMNSAYKYRIQEVLLDLYKEFKRVCDLYEIPYYAYAGTMIGAVREHGIIPWDDDMDIMMFRKDYNRLVTVAGDAFQGKYELQTPHQNPHYLYPVVHLCNNETTAIGYGNSKLDVNLGIFIDIFIIDSVPDLPDEFNTKKELFARYTDLGLKRMAYEINPASLDWIQDPWLKKHVPDRNFLQQYFALEQELTSMEDDSSKQVAIYAELYSGHDRIIFLRDDFKDTIHMPFADTTIPVPSGFDRILTATFGNYMTPVRASSAHGNYFFDVDRSSTYYIDQILASHK